MLRPGVLGFSRSRIRGGFQEAWLIFLPFAANLLPFATNLLDYVNNFQSLRPPHTVRWINKTMTLPMGQGLRLSVGLANSTAGSVLALTGLRYPTAVQAAGLRSAGMEPLPSRSGEAAAAESHWMKSQSSGSELAQAKSPVVQTSDVRPMAIRPAAASTSTLFLELAWVVGCLLVLGFGCRLLLGWRPGWSGARSRGRRTVGQSDLNGMLPSPGFRPRTPHARLHDPVYLQRMLEAELDSSRQPEHSDSSR